ncbi:MAG: 50S ribosomal protein L25 [Candidatus Levybacteria bacterium]|nr:50S ribosomal protein L25 [Candidatus Levybacteria bacterium]
MKHEKLKVEKRKILGKNVKKLRRIGVLPANVYGKDIKSTAVQVKTADFSATYATTGETGLVDLDLEGTIIPVLIQNVYKNFRGNYLHADFFKVNLKEKVKANVPLEIIGEPKAVTEKIGILMNIVSEVEVEALPTDLPEKIEVTVEHLTNIDDQITVADLKVSPEVTVLTDPNQVVSKIGELVTKEAAEQAAQEAAAAEAASAETAAEGAEGQAPAEGEVATEGEAKAQAPAEGEAKPAEEQPAKEGQ